MPAQSTVSSQTITPDDIGRNSSMSQFSGCKFQGHFEGYNFAFSEFSDCDFENATFKHCNLVGIEGNSKPKKEALDRCNTRKAKQGKGRSEKLAKKQARAYLAVTDDQAGQIKADGVTKTKLTIQKQTRDGVPMPGDGEVIQIKNSRGLLAAEEVTLDEQGRAQVNLTSIPENCDCHIMARDKAGVLIDGRATVKFIP